MKPLLVGELNTRNDDPRYDLYPLPENAAGGRLCKLLGITSRQYLHIFDRVNLCRNRWNASDARIIARLIDYRHPAIILLGKKVAAAFGLVNVDLFSKSIVTNGKTGTVVYTVPHPSGRNRVWNDPSNVTRFRRLLSPLIKEARK